MTVGELRLGMGVNQIILMRRPYDFRGEGIVVQDYCKLSTAVWRRKTGHIIHSGAIIDIV